MNQDARLPDIQREAESDFSYEDFVRTRMLYWMAAAKACGSNINLPTARELELTQESSNFYVSAPGPGNVHGILEDAAETGSFYLYDSTLNKILKAIPVYNREMVSVEAEDIDVAWSSDGQICCVAVWAQIRAFLGLEEDIQIRKPIIDRITDGFYANEWPHGFSHLLAKEEG